jgi:RNA polymerase sigma-70 factor (ECF subfamily)
VERGERGAPAARGRNPLRAPETIGHHAGGVPLLDDTDARLVERLVARDERAFNTLVRAYERRVFSVALRMLGGNRAEAEDLAQEVFVQVFKAIGTFRGESKLSTWIYRIAINLAKNRGKYLRVRRTDAHDEIESLDEHGGTSGQDKRENVARIERPDEMMAGLEVEQVVRRAIQELEPSFRECLVLRDVEDLSYGEIGEITGLPEGTVKSRIHRARGQLKELVERALGAKIP